MPDNDIQFVPGPTWIQTVDYKQGDHVTVIGPTGSGKTWLARALARKRQYVISLVTKMEDSAWDPLIREGWKVSPHWPPKGNPQDNGRILLWPKTSDANRLFEVQREAFEQALKFAFKTGKYTIYCDEIRYLSQTLGLKSLLEILWLQGRSMKCGIISCSQRPAWIPLEAYSQAQHLCLFKTRDGKDIANLARISGVDGEFVAHNVGNLKRFEFIHIDTRTNTITKSRL